MLVFNLKLPTGPLHIADHLDPIFISICGLIQAVTVVYKSMANKKKFFKLTFDDEDGEEGVSPGVPKSVVMSEGEIKKNKALSY